MSEKADALAANVAACLHAREGLSASWGIEVVYAREGEAACSMRVREDMTNGHGSLHGGAIFALADTAFAWACNSRNVKTVAQQASISFLSPVRVGERLTAHAREEAIEGRSGAYRVTVQDDDGRTVAIFTGLSRSVGGAVIERSEK